MFNATVVFPFISEILVLLGISLMIASICIINSERLADTLNSCCQCLTNDPNTPVSENILFAASIVLIFGSTLLSLTIHLPTIIIAWNIDPLYDSKFAISYQSIILVNFYTFCYSFIQLTRAGGFIFAIKGNSILKRTQVGVLVRRIPADDGNNQFRFPRAIAVHPVTERVYVADTQNHSKPQNFLMLT